MAVELTNANFKSEVLDYTDGPVLVDFFAPWCGPCQMMGPVIDQLAEEMKDTKAKVFKVNVDAENALAQQFNVMSIPTLIVFRKGEIKETMMGMQQKEMLKSLLESN